MVNLNIEALRVERYNGLEYRRVKSFVNKPEKAENFKKTIEDHISSRRLRPVIEKVKIGLGLGYVYRVCVPKKIYKEVKKI